MHDGSTASVSVNEDDSDVGDMLEGVKQGGKQGVLLLAHCLLFYLSSYLLPLRSS